MASRRAAPQASMSEVLDRVLDRGIVIDAWLRVSVAGITLLDVDARVVVASMDTYVDHSEAVAHALFTSPPRLTTSPPPATPRRARQPRLRLRCEDGCTFVRRAGRCPARVRCPSAHGRACTVIAIPRAA
jgi:gas vesicle structural protein